MWKTAYYLKLSVLLNIVLLTIMVTALVVFRDKWVYRLIEMKGEARIVFFGDSMTSQGRWLELLDRTDLQNSAIASLTTHHLDQQIPYAVLKYSPDICFFMAGINDINMGVCQDKIRANYAAILEKLIDNGITPVVQLTLHEVGDPESNVQVDSLNSFLVDFCKNKGIDYIDVNALLSDGAGLKPEYARDQTHLNNKGYAIWGEEVKKFMKLKGI